MKDIKISAITMRYTPNEIKVCFFVKARRAFMLRRAATNEMIKPVAKRWNCPLLNEGALFMISSTEAARRADVAHIRSVSRI